MIWDKWQATLEPLRAKLNAALSRAWEEWEIPREADASWPASATAPHAEWWKARIARQKEIDASIAAHAEPETLHDKPYTDPGRVRVAGPFTVESLSPYRVMPAEDEDVWENAVAADADAAGRPAPRRTSAPHHWDATDFAQVVLDHLKTSGVHQARKETASPSPASPPGPAPTSPPRAVSCRVRRNAARPSSSVPSSAPSPAPT
ncbi:MAG TPA: hypothetical protein VJ779_15815 [Acetobacteraceae bacterium]|nr:hypothetical protein [Acetobacteraceae bacterium]